MSVFELLLLIGFATVIISGCLVILYILYQLAIMIRADWKKNQECQWVNKDDYCSEYESGCGHGFANMQDGDPVTDWATYCPFCGNKITKYFYLGE